MIFGNFFIFDRMEIIKAKFPPALSPHKMTFCLLNFIFLQLLNIYLIEFSASSNDAGKLNSGATEYSTAIKLHFYLFDK